MALGPFSLVKLARVAGDPEVAGAQRAGRALWDMAATCAECGCNSTSRGLGLDSGTTAGCSNGLRRAARRPPSLGHGAVRIEPTRRPPPCSPMPGPSSRQSRPALRTALAGRDRLLVP